MTSTPDPTPPALTPRQELRSLASILGRVEQLSTHSKVWLRDRLNADLEQAADA